LAAYCSFATGREGCGFVFVCLLLKIDLESFHGKISGEKIKEEMNKKGRNKKGCSGT
jgi:hypothetical protein